MDVCMDVCMDMCVDICIDMCMGMCVGTRIDMCMDTCIGMCMDMCTEMCMDMCTDMCTDTCLRWLGSSAGTGRHMHAVFIGARYLYARGIYRRMCSTSAVVRRALSEEGAVAYVDDRRGLGNWCGRRSLPEYL